MAKFVPSPSGGLSPGIINGDLTVTNDLTVGHIIKALDPTATKSVALQHDGTNAVLDVSSGNLRINSPVEIGGAGFGNSRLWVSHTADNTSYATIEGQLIVAPTVNSNANYYGMYFNVQNSTPVNLSGAFQGCLGQAYSSVAGATIAAAEGVSGNAYCINGIVTEAAGVSGNVSIQGGNIITAIGLWAKPFVTFGGIINTGYGAKIDPPGVGGMQWTLGVGAGSSYLEGMLRVGDNQAPTATLDVHGAFKVSGLVQFGTHQALGGEALTGFIQMMDNAGFMRKLAVVS